MGRGGRDRWDRNGCGYVGFINTVDLGFATWEGVTKDISGFVNLNTSNL